MENRDPNFPLLTIDQSLIKLTSTIQSRERIYLPKDVSSNCLGLPSFVGNRWLSTKIFKERANVCQSSPVYHDNYICQEENGFFGEGAILGDFLFPGFI